MTSGTPRGLQLKLKAKTFSFCKRSSSLRTTAEKCFCFTPPSWNGPQLIQRESKSKPENLTSSLYREMVPKVLPTLRWASRSNTGVGLPSSLHSPPIPTKTEQKVMKGRPPHSSISQHTMGHIAAPSNWEILQVPHSLRQACLSSFNDGRMLSYWLNETP